MNREKRKLIKIKNSPNGITLIALVITVVVMLILAGVAISVLVDGDGLFTKTRTAAEEYKSAAEEEAEQVGSLIDKINSYIKYPLGTTVFTENKTYDELTIGTYNNPIIPKGFYPVNENGATWGTANGYKYGLIIEDADKNQYVWVPVDGTNVKFGSQTWYKVDGATAFGLKADEVSETLPTELTPDANGVIPNGGFYIGRYEAGTGTVSKAGATVYNNVNWNDAKSAAEGKYASTNSSYGAVSTLIYGAQWDTVLKFIQAYNVGEAGYANYATNSVGYGNYSETDGAGDTFLSTSAPTFCGAAPQFKQKNIYDMAGNVWEWTMEMKISNSAGRLERGGSYETPGLDYPTGYRSAPHFGEEKSYHRFPCSIVREVKFWNTY